MKVLFPSYYKDFSCIADKCRHSCCVGWEIDVDDDSVERFRAMDSELGREICSHISGDPASIQLCEGERCPFLDNGGLCRIISSLGQDAVPMICREHPRFYHTVRGRTEGGIGASCEEACRLILSRSDYDKFIELERDIDTPDETPFNTLKHRDLLYELMWDEIYYRNEYIYEIVTRYNLTKILHREDEWNKILSDLEYLDESRRGSLTVGRRIKDREKEAYLTRFFAYLIFRHVSPAENYDNMRARIGFSLLLTFILENMMAEGDPSFEEIVEFARTISEEIEYSEDNTASLIFEIESII
ncbi:MAG: flagellin lysine-N-methylase [Clostridia bacterium]|nr:flagellin lysine-N-methylase [Clostridia bacterium]